VEAAERTRKRLHTVTCYHPALQQRWRDTDWFKTRVPDQTQKRPHFIQSVNRPSPSTLHQRTRTTQPHFHVNGWAEGPSELKCMVRRRTARGLKMGEGTVCVNVSGLLVENRSPGT